MIIDPDWIVCPRLFTAEECDRLIELARELPEMSGDMSWKPAMPEHPEVRSSTLRWVHRNWPAAAWAFERADALIGHAREHFGVITEPFEAFQFTEYHARRRGHYDWHRDDFPDQNIQRDRRLSLCIQLSDPATYGGGRLELRVPNPPSRMLIGPVGAAVCFRSSTQHRVSATVHGTRYSAVAWELGPL